jgi:hypothetical protein
MIHKPPLGVIPSHIYWEKVIDNTINENGGMCEFDLVHGRIVSLYEAINRYMEADLPIPMEWVTEMSILEDVGLNFTQFSFGFKDYLRIHDSKN